MVKADVCPKPAEKDGCGAEKAVAPKPTVAGFAAPKAFPVAAGREKAGCFGAAPKAELVFAPKAFPKTPELATGPPSEKLGAAAPKDGADTLPKALV